jgi:ribosomal protein L6P/L9E
MLVALDADGSLLCVHGKLGALRLPLSTRVAIETCGENAIILREKDASINFSNGKSCPNIGPSPSSNAPKPKNRDIKATLGLSRTLVQNMVTGVSQGFRKKLMLTGVGYRAEIQTSPRTNKKSTGASPREIRGATTAEYFFICDPGQASSAKTNNKSSSSNAADTRSAPSSNEPERAILRLFVGYSHPVDLLIPTGIEVTVPNPTSIEVFGIEKDRVGHFASRIRKVRPPEPYKGKGISYVGEHIRRKLAKSKK